MWAHKVLDVREVLEEKLDNHERNVRNRQLNSFKLSQRRTECLNRESSSGL